MSAYLWFGAQPEHFPVLKSGLIATAWKVEQAHTYLPHFIHYVRQLHAENCSKQPFFRLLCLLISKLETTLAFISVLRCRWLKGIIPDFSSISGHKLLSHVPHPCIGYIPNDNSKAGRKFKGDFQQD